MAVRGLMIVLAVWAWGACCARAEDVVRLFETKGLRPALCSALRIQVSDLGDVRCEVDALDSDLPARIEAAAEVVQNKQARLSVLLERDPNPRRVRMYIVGGRDDEAVIAIENIENKPDPDVDRALALKVRDALDAFELVKQSVAAGASTPLAAVVAPRSVESVPERWAALLEAGGGLLAGGGSGARAAGKMLAGARLSAASLRAELALGARLHSDITQQSGGASVDESEWGPLLSLRGLWSSARFELGAVSEVTFLSMHAQGTTASGARGSKREGSLALSLGLDARVLLFRATSLRFAPAIEVLSVAQRFSVDDRVTMNLGRTRVLVPLSLLLALPLGGET